MNLPSTTKASNTMPKPCRPYTEYNIFFQLEREHILQVQLGFTPEYEAKDIFDPSDTSNYQGPPLPARYDGLVYLYDWHLPGKEKRRKRRHRKTHGMIGFQELSLKIADAWKAVDSETRAYCAELCDIGQIQYKKAMKAYKAAQGGASVPVNKSKSQQGKGKVRQVSTDLVLTAQAQEKAIEKSLYGQNPYPVAQYDFQGHIEPHSMDAYPVAQARSTAQLKSVYANDQGTPNDQAFIPTRRCSMAEVDAAFENDLALFPNNFHEPITETTFSGQGIPEDSARSVQNPFVDVDMDDDAILDIWKSTPGPVRTEGGYAIPTTLTNFSAASATANVINNFSLTSTFPSQAHINQGQDQDISSHPYNPYRNNSYIDETMNDLKNMRMALLNQQIQMQMAMAGVDGSNQCAARSA